MVAFGQGLGRDQMPSVLCLVPLYYKFISKCITVVKLSEISRIAVFRNTYNWALLDLTLYHFKLKFKQLYLSNILILLQMPEKIPRKNTKKEILWKQSGRDSLKNAAAKSLEYWCKHFWYIVNFQGCQHYLFRLPANNSVWPPHSQLWAIFEGTASLFWC